MEAEDGEVCLGFGEEAVTEIYGFSQEPSTPAAKNNAPQQPSSEKKPVSSETNDEKAQLLNEAIQFADRHHYAFSSPAATEQKEFARDLYELKYISKDLCGMCASLAQGAHRAAKDKVNTEATALQRAFEDQERWQKHAKFIIDARNKKQHQQQQQHRISRRQLRASSKAPRSASQGSHPGGRARHRDASRRSNAMSQTFQGKSHTQLYLDDQQWYHGKLNRDAAVERLQSMPAKSYLLRISPKNNGMCLSIWDGAVVKHYMIAHSAHGFSIQGKRRHFRRLQDLIEFYRKNPVAGDTFQLIFPCPKPDFLGLNGKKDKKAVARHASIAGYVELSETAPNKEALARVKQMREEKELARMKTLERKNSPSPSLANAHPPLFTASRRSSSLSLSMSSLNSSFPGNSFLKSRNSSNIGNTSMDGTNEKEMRVQLQQVEEKIAQEQRILQMAQPMQSLSGKAALGRSDSAVSRSTKNLALLMKERDHLATMLAQLSLHGSRSSSPRPPPTSRHSSLGLSPLRKPSSAPGFPRGNTPTPPPPASPSGDEGSLGRTEKRRPSTANSTGDGGSRGSRLSFFSKGKKASKSKNRQSGSAGNDANGNSSDGDSDGDGDRDGEKAMKASLRRHKSTSQLMTASERSRNHRQFGVRSQGSVDEDIESHDADDAFMSDGDALEGDDFLEGHDGADGLLRIDDAEMFDLNHTR